MLQYITHDDHSGTSCSTATSPFCRIHRMRVFHRDARPSNILLDINNDSVVLVDWSSNPVILLTTKCLTKEQSQLLHRDILNNNFGSHRPTATDDLHSFVCTMYSLHNPSKMPI